MASKVRLEIVSGPLQGDEFLFEEHDTLLCGRMPDCHLRLKDDPRVSRHHFLLEISPPAARLRDLGSLNGTWVNKKRYGGRRKGEPPPGLEHPDSPEVDLYDEDHVRAGKTEFVVRVFEDRECSICGRVISVDSANPPNEIGTTIYCASCIGSEVTSRPTDTGTRGAARGPAPGPPDASLPTFVRDAKSDEGRVPDKDGGADKLLGTLLKLDGKASPLDGTLEVAGYEIGERIGVGGYGAVYKATPGDGGEPVAVKVLLSKVAVNDRARMRFLQEIELMRELSHRNLVPLLDHGAAGAAFYFVMEYCEGGSVSEMAKRYGGLIPLDEAAAIVLQALEGLDYAHRQGIVHRDIKPSNILLKGYGASRTAKLTDLGLAKNFEKAGLSGLTVTGTFAGTHLYMPREQVINFKYVTPVSDVWSMGATLYKVLTSEYPRAGQPGQSPMEVILGGRVISLRDRMRNAPRRLCKVIDRSLAVDTADRYQTAAEFRDALEFAL